MRGALNGPTHRRRKHMVSKETGMFTASAVDCVLRCAEGATGGPWLPAVDLSAERAQVCRCHGRADRVEITPALECTCEPHKIGRAGVRYPLAAYRLDAYDRGDAPRPGVHVRRTAVSDNSSSRLQPSLTLPAIVVRVHRPPTLKKLSRRSLTAAHRSNAFVPGVGFGRITEPHRPPGRSSQVLTKPIGAALLSMVVQDGQPQSHRGRDHGRECAR